MADWFRVLWLVNSRSVSSRTNLQLSITFSKYGIINSHIINILLASVCSVRTASYGSPFFPSLGHKRKEKTRSITCLTDRANEANKRYIVVAHIWLGPEHTEYFFSDQLGHVHFTYRTLSFYLVWLQETNSNGEIFIYLDNSIVSSGYCEDFREKNHCVGSDKFPFSLVFFLLKWNAPTYLSTQTQFPCCKFGAMAHSLLWWILFTWQNLSRHQVV